jgi:hypothetical protein
MKKPYTKPYTKMSADELAEATRVFDKPGAAEKCRPLTRKERARWNKMVEASKRRERSKSSDVRILVSIDPELFIKAHRHARKHGHTLSQLVCEGLEATLRKRSA